MSGKPYVGALQQALLDELALLGPGEWISATDLAAKVGRTRADTRVTVHRLGRAGLIEVDGHYRLLVRLRIADGASRRRRGPGLDELRVAFGRWGACGSPVAAEAVWDLLVEGHKARSLPVGAVADVAVTLARAGATPTPAPPPLDEAEQARVRRKLTAAQVVEIRDRYAAGGLTQQALAREYGVARQCVASVVRSRTWRD